MVAFINADWPKYLAPFLSADLLDKYRSLKQTTQKEIARQVCMEMFENKQRQAGAIKACELVTVSAQMDIFDSG